MGAISNNTSEAYLKKARQEIAAWESRKRGCLARLGDFALDPAARLTVSLVPKSLQETATEMVEKSLRLAAHSVKFSVDSQALSRKRIECLGRKKALGLRLRACDALAKEFWNSHCAYAAAQGSAAGVIGFAGIVADISFTLSITIREIRTIALCYGYGPTDPLESDYALHVLRLVSSNKSEARAEIVRSLKEIEQSLAQAVARKNSPGRGKEIAARFKYLMTTEEYAKSLAFDLLQRRALQCLPVTGVVTGATFSAAYANDIGRTAYMCYRRRFIEQSKMRFS